MNKFLSILLGLGLLASGNLLFLSQVFHSTEALPWWIAILFSLWSVGSGIFLVLNSENRPRREADHERRRSRRAFYSLNHGTELVYWVGRDNKILDVNDRMAEVLGYRRDDLIGQSPSFVDQGWIEEAMPEQWSLLATGADIKVETVFRDREGRGFPAELLIKFFQDSDDSYLCIFARDISEQKRVSVELRNAKEMFELYLHGLPVGAFVRDQEGRFLYVNEKFMEWNPGVEPGMTIEDIFNPGMASLVREEDRVTLEVGPMVFLQEPHEDEPNKRYYEIHKFPMRIPAHSPLIGGIVTETTVRRESEARLLENQAFLEATINQSPVGIIILDGNTTNIKICNNGAKDILGIPRDENLTGKTVSFDGLIWEVLNPDRTMPILEQNPLYKAFFHENTSNDKMIIRRSDGGERFVLINSGPIFDSEGKFIAAIVAFLDITELRNAQEQLEDLNRSLEQMVDNRTRELSQSNEALKVTIENLRLTQDQLIESEKLASLGGLVAGVAHEINTPVGVGVTASSYLKEQTQRLKELYEKQEMKKSDLEVYLENARQSTTIILSNLERASNLIKSFKMISVDQSTDQRRKFKPKEYFQELFISLHAPDKRMHVELSIEGDDELVITSYPGSYSQIITNLFMNSCVHGFEGKQEGRISLAFRKEGERLIVIYTDSGCGMDELTLKRIYEPFFTTRRDLGGSGLGMNIVFNLVNQKLGGSIKASSTPGKGTEFLIDVPIEPPEAMELPNQILD